MRRALAGSPGADSLARWTRHVAWLKRRGALIAAVHVVLLAGALYLIAFHLPIRADFSYLLPQDAPAVRDLRKLEARVRSGETVIVVVRAPDPASRAAAMRELAAGFRTIGSDLVEQVEDDDRALRAFLEANRHLLVPFDELQRIEASLARRIDRAKLAANPLYVDLDDDDPAADDRDRRALEELRGRRRDAEARLARSGHVSADGRVGIIQVRAPFRATDAARGRALHAELAAVAARVAVAMPLVEVGFAGPVMTALAEHDAITHGMLVSSVITVLLVGLVVALFFRSAVLLVLLVVTLAVATTISFGLAALTVGHLNAATAFLGAIIAGNGINYGIILMARYREERRTVGPEAALAAAIAGTLRPTVTASLGATIAYGSLAATSFRGFADFAVIGAVGMLVCWVVSFTLLPVMVLWWGRDVRHRARASLLARVLGRVFGFRRPRLVLTVTLAVAVAAGVIVARYIAHDPFEYDIKQLRSTGEAAVTARAWMRVSDRHFGSGLSGRTYIAAASDAQVARIVHALRDREAGVPAEHRVIGSITSILDVVPERQPEQLAILARIRGWIDDGLLDGVDPAWRDELAALRPPGDLAPITKQDLPPQLARRFMEKDGTIGLLISVRSSPHLSEWDGRDLIRFADAVREIDLGDEVVTTSGTSVIFADIVRAITEDGPIVTLVAGVGLIVMCLVVIGPNRRAIAVLVATTLGALLMIATCALLGIKVTFLDFIALPITLGLGVDYAINIAHRYDSDPDPTATLGVSGSAVFVCSLTTIIGYGSLLASENLAIRGFGTAALIGEITCLVTALVVVPAILGLARERRSPASLTGVAMPPRG